MARVKAHDGETIQSILAHTIQCIAEQGYEGASMREIARRSGVAKSLLHYHFSTKEDLLLRAARSMADEIARDITERDRRAGSPVERLAGMATDLYELLLGHTERCAFMTEMYAMAAHNPRVAEMLREYRQTEYQLIEERLRDAMRNQLEKIPGGAEGFAAMVQTMMAGMIAQHSILESNQIRLARWQQIVQFILNGLVLSPSES